VLHQEETLAQLEGFLGIPLARIPVRRDPIGRWRTDEGRHDFAFLADPIRDYQYDALKVADL